MAIPLCRTEPLGDFQFGFAIGDREVTRWCFSRLCRGPTSFPYAGRAATVSPAWAIREHPIMTIIDRYGLPTMT